MGENNVHPLYGKDNILSIKSTKSILSMPIAPELHQQITTNPNGLTTRFP